MQQTVSYDLSASRGAGYVHASARDLVRSGNEGTGTGMYRSSPVGCSQVVGLSPFFVRMWVSGRCCDLKG